MFRIIEWSETRWFWISLQAHNISAMEIITYSPEYQKAFRDLNTEWLEQYFHVEKTDQEVLASPQEYIIDRGGMIFFAREGEEILGTAALMKMEDAVYEFTKMAVPTRARGKGIGQLLMQYTIEYAQAQDWKELIIYTNSTLNNAIHIYKKYGFEQVAIEHENPYDRADIKMHLSLS